jgi:hypothetical protein
MTLCHGETADQIEPSSCSPALLGPHAGELRRIAVAHAVSRASRLPPKLSGSGAAIPNLPAV